METYPTTAPNVGAVPSYPTGGQKMACVPDMPFAFQYLNEMRQQNRQLDELVDRISVIAARIYGNPQEMNSEETTKDRGCGLCGEMQDIIADRDASYNRLSSLVEIISKQV